MTRKENLIFVLLLCFFCNSSSAKKAKDVFFPTKYVKITSVAEGPVFLHCWSVDDDLHKHILNKGQSIHWHFKVNVLWDTTLFMCWVDFTPNRHGEHYWGYFVAYKAHRCVTRHCQYRLTTEGYLQLYNDDKHRWERHSTYRTEDQAESLKCKRYECRHGYELP